MSTKQEIDEIQKLKKIVNSQGNQILTLKQQIKQLQSETSLLRNDVNRALARIT